MKLSFEEKPKIVISPFSRKRRNNTYNAKHYPYWKELVDLLSPNNSIIQIGVKGEEKLVKNVRWNLSFDEIKELLSLADTFITIDSFLPHLLATEKIPIEGVVLFSKSDPKVFGYPYNFNLIKRLEDIRKNQFHWWEEEEPCEECWLKPEEIYNILTQTHLAQ